MAFYTFFFGSNTLLVFIPHQTYSIGRINVDSQNWFRLLDSSYPWSSKKYTNFAFGILYAFLQHCMSHRYWKEIVVAGHFVFPKWGQIWGKSAIFRKEWEWLRVHGPYRVSLRVGRDVILWLELLFVPFWACHGNSHCQFT